MFKYICKICNYNTNRSNNYERHLESSKHKKNCGSVTVINTKKNIVSKQKNSFICNYCNGSYVRADSLARHKATCINKQIEEEKDKIAIIKERDKRKNINIELNNTKKKIKLLELHIDYLENKFQNEIHKTNKKIKYDSQSNKLSIQDIFYNNNRLNIIKNDLLLYFSFDDINTILNNKKICNTLDDIDKFKLSDIVDKISFDKKDQMYVNESGLYAIIFSSKSTKNKLFKDWITYKIIPTFRKFGHCNINANYTHIPFIKNNPLILYDKKHVIYLGYIGVINKEHLFKFGISIDIEQRIKCHKVKFEMFDIAHIAICINNIRVEQLFIKELKKRKILRNIEGQTEIFCLTNDISLNNIKNILKELIDNNPINSKLKII